MKNLLVFLLTVLVFPVSTAFAEENETYIIHDLGSFKIVGEKYRVTVPHEYNGPVYAYDNYGVIDEDGNVVVEQKYRQILPHSEGRAAFTVDGKVGFFDENWNIVIEPQYESDGYPTNICFSEGLAAVMKRDAENRRKVGYIDKSGNVVIDFLYDSARPFENGFAEVGIEEVVYGFNTKTKYGKIDKAGNIVEPLKFGYALGKDYEYFWSDPIDVQLSENLVELNGRRYKNSDIEYPFINYFGYSYMPLTYYGCRMLGINCDWTEADGVMLSGGGVPSEDIIGDNGMTEGVYDKAVFYKGKLTINGRLYEYGDSAYPLIHYKNVVYMPVSWQEGMEALGIEYEFVGIEKLENSDRGYMVFKTK